jgi:imidazoleglycerol phosphate synthase cyclase subunit
VLRPELIEECAERFGSQCVVVAIDAARAAGEGPRWNVRVRSGSDGTALDAIEWAVKAEAMGAGEVLLTSWDRDGTREGYDLALTARVASSVRVPVIASGGAASCEHVLEAIEAGADAVLAAGIFHDGRVGIGEVKQFLSSRGIEVRP